MMKILAQMLKITLERTPFGNALPTMHLELICRYKQIQKTVELRLEELVLGTPIDRGRE